MKRPGLLYRILSVYFIFRSSCAQEPSIPEHGVIKNLPMQETIISWYPEVFRAQLVALAKNPHVPESPLWALWNEQIFYNFPVLVASSLALEETCRAQGVKRVLFATRDGINWIRCFSRMFPEIEAVEFHVSRKAVKKMSTGYECYCREVLAEPCLIADGQGTGTTYRNLFKTLGFSQPYQFIVASGSCPGIVSTWDINASDEIERLNCAPIGVLLDVVNHVPLRADSEHPFELVQAQISAFDTCLAAFVPDRNQPLRAFAPKEIVRALLVHLGRCSASRQYLPHLSNH